MEGNTKKIAPQNALKTFKELLAWKFFPFITAAWVIACYYLGLDLTAIYFCVAVAVAMLLLLGDLTPLVPHFLFFNVIVSCENTPLVKGGGGSDYYLRLENIIQLGILIGILAIAIIARIAVSVKNKKFKPSPVFFGICAMCVAFLFNGVGSEDYEIKNLAFAALWIFVISGSFTVVSMNTELCEKNYTSVAYGFVAFSALLVFELAIKYAVNFEELTAGGQIHRELIIMGWGVWNNIGMFFAICIPPVCLLASKYKYGFLFTLYAAILVCCAFLTGSRQAMLGSSFAFAASAIALLVKSKNRSGNAIILGAILIGVVVTVACTWNHLIEIINRLLKNIFSEDGYNGNGRMRLIKLAINYFKSNPATGCGFYAPFESFELAGMGGIIPTFAHNTVFEVLGTCGILGIVGYAAHRITTVIGFFKKPSADKFFMATCLLTFIIICLFDNYLFYILPTAVYGATLPFATGKQKN